MSRSAGRAMRRGGALTACWVGVCLPLAAFAQEGSVRSWVVTPGAELSETFTDNYRLRAEDKASDAITRVSGRLGVRGRSAQLQGFLDYSLSGLVYARHSSENSTQQALNSALTANLVDNWLALDAGASITRSAVSAFGAASGNSELVNSNTTEVRSLRVSPRVRGQFAGVLAYSGDVSWASSNAVGRDQGDTRNHGASFRIQPLSRGKLGWSTDVRHEVSDFKLGRQTTTTSLGGGLNYGLDALDLELRANGGLERSDLSSASPTTRGTWGVGLSWVPSPRARADLDYGERFFGRTHNVRLEYRTPRTVWQVSSGRSLSNGNGQGGGGSRGTAFEVFYNLLAFEPDQNRRLARTVQLLRQAGVEDPNKPLDASFLTAAATVVETVQLSAAWRSQRQTAVLTLSQDTNSRIDGLSQLVGDLADSTRVRSRSASLNLSHQLSPDASLAVSASWREAVGTQTTQYSQQRQLNLLWSQTLGLHLTGSIGLRRALYQTSAAPYSESALTLNLGARF